uniref:Uncharacterized protein n=1 Tax=Romanomermis culicivorax TaxID=13658 RepID=A0A915L688_ROMCU
MDSPIIIIFNEISDRENLCCVMASDKVAQQSLKLIRKISFFTKIKDTPVARSILEMKFKTKFCRKHASRELKLEAAYVPRITIHRSDTEVHYAFATYTYHRDVNGEELSLISLLKHLQSYHCSVNTVMPFISQGLR